MKSIVVVGAGGNIGSHLVPHLGRMPGIDRVTLVDRDVYESRNLSSQSIFAGDIGKPKARVQARRLLAINPALQVVPLVESIENLPVGHLRSDLILTALDSRASRQCVNEIAWRLGVPWCDSGVRSEDSLARITVFVPGGDVPCLECAWSDSDYEMIEQVYPCLHIEAVEGTPTNAPSSLGALAAAMLALECRKMLENQFDRAAISCDVVIDAQWHRHCVTRYQRNSECRFDHRSWLIEKLRCRLDRFTLEDALRLGDRVELNRMPFVTRLMCPRCGGERSLFYLAAALSHARRNCHACGNAMTATGFDVVDRIDSRLPRRILRLSLRRAGLRVGDVFHAGNGKYFEIVCD